MANSTSANLKLTVQATGENSGTWGQITNTNLLILEQAIGGFTTFNLTNANRSLTFTNGAVSNGKNDVIKLTGTLAGTRTVSIPDGVIKMVSFFLALTFPSEPMFNPRSKIFFEMLTMSFLSFFIFLNFSKFQIFLALLHHFL